MDNLLLFAGIMILLLVLYDITKSTLLSSGDGLLLRGITQGVWLLLLTLSNRDGTKKMLEYGGALTLLVIFMVWITLTWAGHSLIFLSATDPVINSTTKDPADTFQTIYFVGYSFSTLGYGDFKPATDFWRFYAVFTSFTGFLLLTTAITYITPVLNADIYKHKLSLYINSLGSTPEQVLLQAWNGKDFQSLEPHFNSLIPLLTQHSQDMLAHPILHNFHTSQPHQASVINLATLDQALTLLLLYVPAGIRPGRQTLEGLRRTLTHYLQAVGSESVILSAETPPLPSPEALRQAGVPLLSEEGEPISATKFNRRQKLWRGLLEKKGWCWEDLSTPEPVPELEK